MPLFASRVRTRSLHADLLSRSAGLFLLSAALCLFPAAGSAAEIATVSIYNSAPGAGQAQNPTANPGGPYTGASGAAIAFTGTGSSDPQAQALTYAWDFGDTNTSTAANPTHAYTLKGTYTVSLTVTDSAGLSNQAFTTATVSANTSAPHAVITGPVKGSTASALSFSAASSTDPKGEALTYAWDFRDGGTSNVVNPTHQFASPGTYVVALAVTDTDGLTSRVKQTVTIGQAATPVANAGGPYSGTAGTPIALTSAGSSDANGEALTYLWDFGDGSTDASANPVHTFKLASTYTVTLSVTNTDGINARTATSVTTKASPNAPKPAITGPTTGTATSPLSFSGASSTDPQGETLTYAWNFGDGATSNVVNPTHAFANAGTYIVALLATNTDGLQARVKLTVRISARATPIVNIGGPYSGVMGSPVALNGSGSSDPNNEPLTYQWSFGDGTSDPTANPTHIFKLASTYLVTLTVTNTDGISAQTAIQIPIGKATGAPSSVITGPSTGMVGATLSFSGSSSSDPKGETLTYAWDFRDGTTSNVVNPTHAFAAAGTYVVALVVTNTDGLTARSKLTVTVSTVQPPVANAGGPYSGAPGAAIVFNGSASSDPRGETLTYAWKFGDGATGNGANPSHTYGAAGSYTASLTVTNTDGQSATASAAVTVTTPPSTAPRANAGGPYTSNANTALTVSAAGSTDPKGETLSYAWTFGDGGSATGVSPSHTYTSAGTFTIFLTATDTDGLSGTASTTVSVGAGGGQTPVANPGGPYTGTAGVGVSFNGTASSDPTNPTGGPFALTYMWDFGDGGQGAGATPSHTYAKAGTYTVALTVRNASGINASGTTSAAIAAATVSGIPSVTPNGPYTGTAGTAVSFAGTASDPNSLPLTYHWEFGDGITSELQTPSHIYVGPGTYSVTETVSNGNSANSASTTATISPASPASLSASAGGPYSIAQGQVLTFDASKTTNPNGRVLTYTWAFGDGATGSGLNPGHAYAQQGAFTVSLTVNDGAGQTGNASTQVTVTAPPTEAVTALAGGPYAQSTGQAVVFDASASTDNLTYPLTYSWSFGDGSTGTGVTPSHAYTAPGTYTATVTASSATASGSASVQVVVTAALQVVITSPTANTLFAASTTTVTGTLNAPNLTVIVNGIAAMVSGQNFTATGVSLREGVSLITATATDGKGGVGNGTVSVIMDATAPTVSITTPADGSTLTSATTTVTGLVNDIVTGTIGSNDVTVTVNGQPAQVSNRSFMLPNLLLAPGSNSITVVATDRVGNASQTTATVQLVPPTRQLSLTILSGNAQTAAVETVLAQPLLVQLAAADGTAVPGRPITFTVTRSDGMVEVLPAATGQSVFASSDPTGRASVLFQLGSRNGVGVNQVTASTPGAVPVVFTESSTLAAPNQIHAVYGEAQRGLLGQALPEAFQVIVQDAYNNPVPGVAIAFTQVSGDGTLDHANPVTDSNGKAIATLTLGQQEGVNNYVVQATFQGNPGSPITFGASGYAAGPVAATSVSGTVLDNANTPIPNASVRLLGTNLNTVSDVNGRFLIPNAPVGIVTLSVDGSTSTRPETFPFLSFVLDDLPGQNNTLNKPVYLPSIDVDNAQTVGGDYPVTLTVKGVPGLSFVIAPHSVTFPDGSTVGNMSVSQVKSDMVPMPPTNGSGPDLIWTMQPAGARFSVPVKVTMPNTLGLAPGTVSEFYQYDHDLEQFVSAGTAHVSADGSVIVSDPGFGVTKAGWAHAPNKKTKPACVVSCDDHNECTADSSFDCGCTNTKLNSGSCGGDTTTNSCVTKGQCINGVCNGPHAKDGTECDDNIFCTNPDKCTNGLCAGTPITFTHVDGIPSPTAIKWEKAFESGLDPLKVFFNTYGALIDIKPTFGVNYNQDQSCCEVKHDMNSIQGKTTITAGIDFNTGQILLPGYSVNFAGIVKIGVYVDFNAKLHGDVNWKTDSCTDIDCATAALVLDVNVELGVAGGLAGFNLSGGINAGLTTSIEVGCHAVIESFGTQDVKLVVAAESKSSGHVYGAEFIVVRAQTIGSSTQNYSAQ